MKKKIQLSLLGIGTLILGAAANTYSNGDIDNISFFLQMIVGLEVWAVSYMLGGIE